MTDDRAALRSEVREFLAGESFTPACNAWSLGWDPEFSKRLGARGWIGMTWPKEYGGHERSNLDRQVVAEELLAAGAPAGAHWTAERQIGPMLLRETRPHLKERLLPAMARGECYFSIGMSEPDAGSDLAAVRTRGTRVDGGWLVNGRKIWTSKAQYTDYCLVLARTSGTVADRGRGLTRFLVQPSDERITASPIKTIAGTKHFNEVVFDDAFVPDEMVIGEEGEGWGHVTAELALERSGPERYMSNFPLLAEAFEVARVTGDTGLRREVARSTATTIALRELSRGVYAAVDAGSSPVLEAALVKEVGTRFDQALPQRVAAQSEDVLSLGRLPELIEDAALWGPTYTLRGGTNEILKGIIARGLGLR